MTKHEFKPGDLLCRRDVSAASLTVWRYIEPSAALTRKDDTSVEAALDVCMCLAVARDSLDTVCVLVLASSADHRTVIGWVYQQELLKKLE